MLSIEDILRELLAEVLGEPAAMQYAMEQPLLGHIPKLDSLSVFQLIVGIEKKFNIKVQDGDITASAFMTLGNLTQWVKDRT